MENLIEIIKKNQKENGIGHGDYKRYRQYCSRRIHRLQLNLKKRGLKNNAEKNVVADEGEVMSVVLRVERAWSYGMELKGQYAQELKKEFPNVRIRFHLVGRLRKAVKYVEALVSLMARSGSEKAQLECDGYASFMRALLAIETENYAEAFDLLSRAQTIYNKLSAVLSHSRQAIYTSAINDEILPNIRLCEYHMKQQDGSIPKKSMNMLEEKLDLILLTENSSDLEENEKIIFKNTSIQIKSEKVSLRLLSVKKNKDKIDDMKEKNMDMIMKLYDNILNDYNDIISLLKDDKKNLLENTKKNINDNVQNLENLMEYVQYCRLEISSERTFMLADSIPSNRPNDLLRQYETLLQQLQDIMEIISSSSLINARISLAKAYRCYFMSMSFVNIKEYYKARVILDRGMEHVKTSLELFDEVDSEEKQNYIARLKSLERDIQVYEMYLRATSFAADMNCSSDTARSFTTSDDLDKFVILSNPSSPFNIMEFPPSLQPVPIKPVMFDLALSNLNLPNLSNRISETKKKNWFSSWLG